MGACNSNKINQIQSPLKKNDSNGLIISSNTQLSHNYLCESTIKDGKLNFYIDISLYYEFGESLGRGNYGIVRDGTIIKYNISNR